MNDPVTQGDMLSHEQMYFSLLKMFPDVKIVSEEKSSEVPDSADIKPINLNNKEVIDKLGKWKITNFIYVVQHWNGTPDNCCEKDNNFSINKKYKTIEYISILLYWTI